MSQDKPVRENLLKFVEIVRAMTGPFGVQEDKDAMDCVALLEQAVQRMVFNKDHPNESNQIVEKRRFIAAFRTRYLQLTDREYKVSEADYANIRKAVDKLKEASMALDEFLAWLFDDFLVGEGSKFCPPTIKLACGDFVLDKFLYLYKDKIKDRREESLRKQEMAVLIARSRELMRSEDKNVSEGAKKIIDDFRAKRIVSVTEFRAKLEALVPKTETKQ